MRLVCPNCGAQYEVDDRVIPDNGRDVQCSSCGHGWYQMPLQAEAMERSRLDEAGAADEAPGPEDEAAPEREAGPGPAAAASATASATGAATGAGVEAETGAEPEPGPEPAPQAGQADDEAPSGAPSAPKRPLDDDLRAILKEEAEREMEARATERSHEPEAMEIQPDLGLDAAPGEDASRAAAANADDGDDGDDDETEALLAGDTDGEGAAVPGGDGSGAAAAAGAGTAAATTAAAATTEAGKKAGRELFPDIDEINSTLDSHGGLDTAPEIDAEGDRQGGFGRGFFAVIFLAALALALYLVAPRLAETIPALEPVLTGYVGAVDAARAWLDTTVQGLTGKIDAPAGADGG